MKTLLSLIVLIALASVGAYYGSPYYTVWRLEQAAKGQDAATVARFIDFPAVRANLSPKLAAALAVQIDQEQSKPHSILDRIGLAIAPLFHHDHPGETLITADGVAVMVKTAHAPSYKGPLDVQREPDAAHPGEPYTVAEGYTHNDLDQFHATVGNRLRPGAEVKLRLLRFGFLTWKVTALDLDRDPAAKASAAPILAP